MPPVTSVVARWGRALGTACRRVCFLPRDRRGRRRGAPSPAPSATRLDGFPRFRVANVIFSAAIVKVSLSLSSPRPLARLLAAAGRPPPRRRAPDAPDSTLLLFKPFHLTGLRGDNARTHCIEAVVCGVKAQAHRACGHGPHTPHKNLVNSSRPAAPPPRTALTSGPPERRLAHAHKFECALGHGRSPTSQHFTPACQHWGFRLRLASATPQGAPAAALAASLSLF